MQYSIGLEFTAEMKAIYIDEMKARKCLAVLVERAHFGQESVILRDGAPFATLVAERKRLPRLAHGR